MRFAITGYDQLRVIRVKIQALANDMSAIRDESVLLVLEALQARLRPNTPVITGNMKSHYYTENWGAGKIQLLDRMFYAGYVVFGTSRSRANQTLLNLIQDVDRTIGADIDALMYERLRTRGLVA